MRTVEAVATTLATRIREGTSWAFLAFLSLVIVVPS